MKDLWGISREYIRFREITRAKYCCRSSSSIFEINKYTYSESLIQYKTRNKYSLLFVA